MLSNREVHIHSLYHERCAFILSITAGGAHSFFTSREVHIHSLYHGRCAFILYITRSTRSFFTSREVHVHSVRDGRCTLILLHHGRCTLILYVTGADVVLRAVHEWRDNRDELAEALTGKINNNQLGKSTRKISLLTLSRSPIDSTPAASAELQTPRLL